MRDIGSLKRSTELVGRGTRNEERGKISRNGYTAFRVPRPAPREGGFTLLEVMIALAIVGIALVALLALSNRSIAVNARLQKITQATLLAQDKMTEVEVILQQDPTQLTNQKGVFDKPFDGYRWRTTFEDTPLPSVKQVTVTVLWGEEKRNEMVELTSFVSG
jgi:general secretion pathway protein I